jgi:hypothetical protein
MGNENRLALKSERHREYLKARKAFRIIAKINKKFFGNKEYQEYQDYFEKYQQAVATAKCMEIFAGFAL